MSERVLDIFLGDDWLGYDYSFGLILIYFEIILEIYLSGRYKYVI